MSWSVSFVARSKGAAVAAIDRNTVTEINAYGMPKDMANAIKFQVLRIQEDQLGTKGVILVETSGHFSNGQGNASFKVQGIVLEE